MKVSQMRKIWTKTGLQSSQTKSFKNVTHIRVLNSNLELFFVW